MWKSLVAHGSSTMWCVCRPKLRALWWQTPRWASCCCGGTASPPTRGDPAGRVDEGETPIEAAARETYEETGWQPGPISHLTTYYPHNGSSDATFHLFTAQGATYVGDPPDASESERVEWLTLPRLRAEIAAGRVGDGLSLTALLWWLTFQSFAS